MTTVLYTVIPVHVFQVTIQSGLLGIIWFLVSKKVTLVLIGIGTTKNAKFGLYHDRTTMHYI
jgi:hypothetical protein